MKYRDAYINRISDWLNAHPTQLELFWKGRVGLYALLKAFGIQKNDEVILPAFTCVVVPNAIIYCGAKPIYVDIKSETLNTNLENIKAKVNSNTKVIIIQNTFGLSNHVQEIVAFAKANNILTIEDCTHGFGGEYKGKPNGSHCDAAFYSTQWNKPFSTGIGGFAVMNNTMYLEAFTKVNNELGSPSKKDRYILASLIQAKKYLLHDSTYWTAIKLYRRMSKSGLVVGSSKGEELTGTKMPKDYFLRSVKVQEKVGEKALQYLPEQLRKRKENGMRYNTYFRSIGKWNYQDEDLKNHSFLNYPVFVKDKEAFKAEAENEKIRLGDWFVSPIHPVLDNFEIWNLNTIEYPESVIKSAHILNLPTTPKSMDKVIAFLEKHNDLLL